MKYYRLLDDIEYPKRWYLGEINTIDNWQLLNKTIDIENDALKLELYRDGREMDYTVTEVFGIPIVSDTLKDMVGNLDGLSFIPVKIENKKQSRNILLWLFIMK
ncbi:hypothetical protein HPC37_06235 [Pasteurellaceae bacterium 20609_3]|uniref:hypothetical protein n=1 Tax=Spirabiliibacterium mucosae TaxID=28156 RepID=UPI001AADAE9C|nr:hypothetical protein [Spirabiliibacterium mucosae]MBE2898414.1 hypothetical protein [Spirabiliibacterium mucosae]